MSSRPRDSRPDDETKLDAWTAADPHHGPEPSGDDEPRQQPSSGSDGHARELAAIFEDVTGDATFTEPQEETPSHDPIEGEFDLDISNDGLDDAADSDLQIGGWI